MSQLLTISLNWTWDDWAWATISCHTHTQLAVAAAACLAPASDTEDSHIKSPEHAVHGLCIQFSRSWSWKMVKLYQPRQEVCGMRILVFHISFPFWLEVWGFIVFSQNEESLGLEVPLVSDAGDPAQAAEWSMQTGETTSTPKTPSPASEHPDYLLFFFYSNILVSILC